MAVGDGLLTELEKAQREWLERALGVDFKITEIEGVGTGLGEDELEATRRRHVRAELQARVRSVTEVTTQRLKAVTPGSHGATELLGQVKRLKATMDQAMLGADLLSDEVEPERFDKAAEAARFAIEALQAPWQELQTTATAQGIETEQLTEARQREVEQEGQSRDYLKQLYTTTTEQATDKLRQIRVILPSPGQSELDLRDATAKVYLAMEHPDYSRPPTHDRFVAASAAVHRAIEALQTLIEDKLGPELERAEAISQARAALTQADESALKATQSALLFGDVSKALSEGLANARTGLDLKTKKQAEEAKTLADKEVLRAGLIADAETAGKELQGQVQQAVKAADATPGEALSKAWNDAVEEARKRLLAGTDAAATLKGIDVLLKQTQELSKTMADLRQRAKAWQEDRDKLSKPPPSEPEAKTIASVPALLERVRGDVAALGTLETEMKSAEEALKPIVESIGIFVELRGRVEGLVKDAPTIKGWKRTPKLVIDGAISSATSARLKDPKTGIDQLNNTLKLAEAMAQAVAVLDRCLSLYASLSPAVLQLGPASLNSRIGTAVDSGGLKQLQPLIDEVLQLEKSLEAISELRKLAEPHVKTCAPLRTSKVNEIKVTVTKLEAQAEKEALAGKKDLALATMQSLIDQLPALDKFQREGGPVITQATKERQNAGGPLGTMLNRLINGINEKVKGDDFNEAMNRVGLLADVLPKVPAYRKAYDAALKDIQQAETLKPADLPSVPDENKAFRETLGTALDGTAGQMETTTVALNQLAQKVQLAIKARQKALRDAVGGKADDPRAASLFADEETATATLALMESLGAAELKKLIGGIGKDGDVTIGPKIASALKALSKDLDGGKIKALGGAIGGLENFGKLCGENGETSLPVNLHKQFESDLGKLTSLVDDGLGGDVARLRDVAGGGATGATRAKALSDGFADRGELVTLIANLGTDAEAKDIMTAICDTHFGGDWKKMKTPFFDELSGDPDAPRLMKKAKNFKGQAAPGGMPTPALSGFKTVDMEHVVQRHRPDSFKLESSNVKPDNTQFAPGTTPEVIADIIGTALAELRLFLGGTPNPKVTQYGPGGVFMKYRVEVTVPGVLMQIGYDTGTLEVDQAFPVSLLGGATITLDDFDNSQMNKILKGLGK